MIIFQNPGIIDLAAVETFGVSVKDTKSPIGMFGTGLKYAIAIILREGDNFSIFAGKTYYPYSKRAEMIRGQEFDVVYQDHQRMAFTTQHGKNWEPWQAFRELWSNCKDEGGKVWWVDENDPDQWYQDRSAIDQQIHIPEDHTTIIWSGPVAEQVWRERDTVILRTDAMTVSNRIEVHAGNNTNCYYQGIRVFKMPKPSVFTYNFLDGVMLTEDRTMAHWHMMPARIARAVLESSDPAFIEGVLVAKETSVEGKLPWDAVKDVQPTQTFASIALQLKEEDRLGDGAKGLFVALKSRLRSYGIEDPTIVKLGPMALQIVNDAKKLLPEAIRQFYEQPGLQLVAKTGWRDGMRANYYMRGNMVAINAHMIDAGVEQTALCLIRGAAMSFHGQVEEQLLTFILKGQFVQKEAIRWIDEDLGLEDE